VWPVSEHYASLRPSIGLVLHDHLIMGGNIMET